MAPGALDFFLSGFAQSYPQPLSLSGLELLAMSVDSRYLAIRKKRVRGFGSTFRCLNQAASRTARP